MIFALMRSWAVCDIVELFSVIKETDKNVYPDIVSEVYLFAIRNTTSVLCGCSRNYTRPHHQCCHILVFRGRKQYSYFCYMDTIYLSSFFHLVCLSFSKDISLT